MKKRAFTLIELLVVIAIIAILAAILFPVFAQAKAAAKKTQSLSNTKNITMGMLLYTGDADDKYPTLQSYHHRPGDAAGTCNHQVKWQDAIHPYIKNGRGVVSTGSLSGNFDDGLFKSPGGAVQTGSNYAVHQDVFMDGAAPWTGCAPEGDFRTFSQTQFDNIADKVMIMERGNSGGEWAFLQFSTWRWDWDVNNCQSPDCQNSTGEGDVARAVGRDCDGGFNGGDTWAYCSMFARYRYSNSTPFAYFDGHAKSMNRSAGVGTAATSQINWAKNILIPEAIRPSWSSWYFTW